MQKVIPMKSFIEQLQNKPMSKAEILFYKLLPKWKNHKSWDFIKADVYPKPEIRPGGTINDSV